MIEYRIICLQFVIILIGLCLPFLVFAQSTTDSFVVSQQIGDDTIAPTIPSFVTPTPVAATQIDITWGASTDDQNLTGYRLFRDAVHIATTSLTSYSDTGLTPSTTYVYTVEAYDWFFNISTTSASAATTTLALPVVPPSATSTVSENGVGSQTHPRLISLQVESLQKSTQFSWDTNIYTRYVLRWGSSSGYDLGFIQNDVYSRSHTTYIRDLEPDTEYMFELVGVNQLGHEFVLKRGAFTTQDEKDIIAPANVSDVRTTVDNNSVYIQWVNPIDADFEKVRVVRNYLFYPADPVDGFIVYEGSAQSIFDAGALKAYPDQYYTIFAYDTSGNLSSGAVVFARRGGEIANITNDSNNDSTDGTTASEIEGISFLDVRFIQENQVLPQENREVVIESKFPLGIQIPAELLSNNLKTIVVTLTDRYDDSQSYILRNNSQQTMYQALLRSLPEGIYRVSFSIYDYQTQLETKFGGKLVSQKWISSNDIQNGTKQVVQTVTYSLFAKYGVVAGSTFLLFIFWWFLFLARRSREDN